MEKMRNSRPEFYSGEFGSQELKRAVVATTWTRSRLFALWRAMPEFAQVAYIRFAFWRAMRNARLKKTWW
jgi:hypothetical protein